ncbi:hypothetical protein MMC32_007032 [Xylographa parallela]|nr:hypothetical protein [Xylographa parallela]
MVNLLPLSAATANFTNTTFAHKLSLTDGPLGLQELTSTLSFPANYGISWTVSTQTSDLAALIFTLVVLTFAIDHYLFNSRYLVHIHGANRAKSSAVALDVKAALHEKEALKVESGQKSSDDGESDPTPRSKHDSDRPASTAFARWVRRSMWISVILFLVVLGVEQKKVASETNKETLESSSTKAEAEGQADRSLPTSRWDKVVQHPWSKAIMHSAILLVGTLVMLVVFMFHLLFWPMMLAYLILQQCAMYEHFNDNAVTSWQSIALMSTLQLAIWTAIGAALLVKPNRIQGVLWKCFKWTHAVNWWLFWGITESYSVGCFVARYYGFQYSTLTMEVIFILQPTLVAYLYSGVVCDVAVAVRLCKLFWNNVDLQI